MTMRIYDADLSDYVDVPNFLFSDSTDWMRAQAGAETADGRWLAVDRGYKNKMVAGIITGMTLEQMQDMRDFFLDTLEMGLNEFYIRKENNRESETWNPFKYPWRIGSTVGGTSIKVGNTYKVGERVAIDYEFVGPLRMRKNALKFTEKPGHAGGVFEVSLAATQEQAD